MGQIPSYPALSSVSTTDKLVAAVGTANKVFYFTAGQMNEFVNSATSGTYSAIATLISGSGLKEGYLYFVSAPTDVYAGGSTYALGDEVTDGSGNYYKSLQNGNTGNALTDTAWWKPVQRDLFFRAVSTSVLAEAAIFLTGESIQYNFSNDVQVGGLLYSSTTQVGTTAGTSEETLASYTLWGNSSSPGKICEVEASGFFANNANDKTLRMYFGSVAVDTGTDTIQNNAWFLKSKVFIDDVAAQTVESNIFAVATGAAPFQNTTGYRENSALTETISSNILIRITGQNGTASANDIVLDTVSIRLI